jgi:hypothetical protein
MNDTKEHPDEFLEDSICLHIDFKNNDFPDSEGPRRAIV